MNPHSALSKLRDYFIFVGEDALLLCSVGLAILFFAVVFVSGLIKKRSFHRLRSLYIILGAGLLIVVLSVLLLCGGAIATGKVLFITLVTAGIYTFLYIPVFLFCGRVRVGKSHKEFIRALDGNVKSEEPGFLPKEIREYKNAPDRESVSVILPEKEEEARTAADVDFTHVKNVISRLDYFGLSQTDKNTVNELSSALKIAESSGMDETLKTRINDGLGALLKIMSKYNI